MNCRVLKYIIIATIALSATLLVSAQNTSRKISTKQIVAAVPDTAFSLVDMAETAECNLPLFDPSVIKISGYEKRASDYRETFFITNKSPYDISAVELQLEYFLTDGTQLHKYKKLIRTEVPAGETRKVDISGFDTQRRFYYYQSKAPRRGGTPFKVSIKVTRYDIIAREKH